MLGQCLSCQGEFARGPVFSRLWNRSFRKPAERSGMNEDRRVWGNVVYTTEEAEPESEVLGPPLVWVRECLSFLLSHFLHG